MITSKTNTLVTTPAYTKWLSIPNNNTSASVASISDAGISLLSSESTEEIPEVCSYSIEKGDTYDLGSGNLADQLNYTDIPISKEFQQVFEIPQADPLDENGDVIEELDPVNILTTCTFIYTVDDWGTATLDGESLPNSEQSDTEYPIAETFYDMEQIIDMSEGSEPAGDTGGERAVPSIIAKLAA